MRIFDKYIPQFVYGAFDGIVTTYAVIAAAAASGMSSTIVVIFGLANLTADGFSMGASAFLSHQAEQKGKKRNKRNSPFRLSFATFLSFLFVGFMPVIPYFIDIVTDIDLSHDQMFIISSILTGIMFVWVGYAKSIHFKKTLWMSMFETFLLGIVAAGLAYFVGALLKDVFGA